MVTSALAKTSERPRRERQRRALGVLISLISLPPFFFLSLACSFFCDHRPSSSSLAAGHALREKKTNLNDTKKCAKKKRQRESDILSSIDQTLPVYSSVDGGGDPSSGGGSPARRPRVVVLGSGWGAMSFVKALSTAQAQEIDLTVISPRNYFLYTPLLPAVATGTVEERSIVEPVRKVLGGKGAYFEAVCHSIDPAAKKLVCW